MMHKSSNRSISRRGGRVRALSKPIGFLLLPLVVSLATSSSLSSIPAARSKRRRRPQNAAAHASTKHSGCCDGKAAVSSHRKACGFYVWDLPSALLYKWCQHLVKDKIYEGKGGYVFVRYESNSILKLLYPCSRYSPNKCMICGGSYDDHLELWWSKHLYSPYDQYLDRTYNEALVLKEEDGMTNKQRRLQRRNKRKSSDNSHGAGKQSRTSSFVKTISASSPFQTLADPPIFNFHKRYVEDVTDMVRGARSRRDQKKLLQKKLPASRSNHLMIPSRSGLTYIVPNVGGYGYPHGGDYTKKDSLIDICAVMLYSCIDNLISLQHWEFANEKQKKSRANSHHNPQRWINDSFSK